MIVAILTTGGTIEKTFDATDGSLRNVRSVLEDILSRMMLPSLRTRHFRVMSKDSLEMTEEDRRVICEATGKALPDHDAVVIVHGTDTLAVTGEHLCRHLADLQKPVVLTGAMRPYEFRDTDAFQNVAEALLACRVLGPGVYCVMHNQVLRFPGVEKDRVRMSMSGPAAVR